MTVRRFTISQVPPSINAQKSAVLVKGKARLIKTKPYRQWIEATTAELKDQPGFEGDFFWRSDILFPCNVSKMDVDNVPKAIHDVLVSMGKVPDDRYLADTRIRWATGDKIVVAIKAEELSKWTAIKKISSSLTQKLVRYSPSTQRLL